MDERKLKQKALGVVIAALCLLLVVVMAAAEQADTQATPQATPTPQPVPDVIEIDNMVNLYDSVTFTHEMHVEFADSCASCHHHSPAGVTPACSACHPKAKKVEGTQDKLSLKAAYHKQCMDCHRDMGSGPMKCTECHAKRQAPASSGNQNQQGE